MTHAHTHQEHLGERVERVARLKAKFNPSSRRAVMMLTLLFFFHCLGRAQLSCWHQQEMARIDVSTNRPHCHFSHRFEWLSFQKLSSFFFLLPSSHSVSVSPSVCPVTWSVYLHNRRIRLHRCTSGNNGNNGNNRHIRPISHSFSHSSF